MIRAVFARCMAPCALLLLPALTLAQDKVEQLEKKVEQLEKKVQDLNGQTNETFDEYDQRMSEFSKMMSALGIGNRKFVLTGYASAAFETAEGSDSTFFAGFNPIFLWKLNDRLFFESEVEFEAEDQETKVELEYAQISFVINDYMILGMGKFLNPANVFAANIHPAWINKLPDKPLAIGADRFQNFTQTGVQLHGGVPVGSQKINYAVYVSNGAMLEEGAGNYGTLEEDNFTDSNNNKAVGGRIGYFPLPELELGYSIELSNVTATGSEVADADATVQSVDLGYVVSAAKGTIDLRGQWAFADVDDVTFDPLGTGGFGPVMLDNKRDGGYVQAAYRATDFDSEIVNNLEGVVRYDSIDLPSGAPEGTDRSRLSLGLDYWISPTSLFKIAYEIDDTDSPGVDSDAFIFQWAAAF